MFVLINKRNEQAILKKFIFTEYIQCVYFYRVYTVCFKYLGTTLTNQNSIVEEIKSRLRSGNASHYSVQNRLSSRLLSKNLKIKIYI